MQRTDYNVRLQPVSERKMLRQQAFQKCFIQHPYSAARNNAKACAGAHPTPTCTSSTSSKHNNLFCTNCKQLHHHCDACKEGSTHSTKRSSPFPLTERVHWALCDVKLLGFSSHQTHVATKYNKHYKHMSLVQVVTGDSSLRMQSALHGQEKAVRWTGQFRPSPAKPHSLAN